MVWIAHKASKTDFGALYLHPGFGYVGSHDVCLLFALARPRRPNVSAITFIELSLLFKYSAVVIGLFVIIL